MNGNKYDKWYFIIPRYVSLNAIKEQLRSTLIVIPLRSAGAFAKKKKKAPLLVRSKEYQNLT